MDSVKSTLTEHCCDKVLERLGLPRTPEPNLQGLTMIYQAWCEKIPFDNILKRIMMVENSNDELPGLLPEDFFDSWLKYGIGGTCWASQGALKSLLDKLRFSANYVLSTMLSSGNENSLTPGHGSIMVNFENAKFIIDPTMLHANPLPLLDYTNDHPVWKIRVHYKNDFWCVNWKPLGRPYVDCRLLNINASSREFIYHHKKSRGTSRFNSATIIRVARKDSIVGLVKGEKITRRNDGVEIRQQLNHRQQLELLIDELKIDEQLAMKVPLS